MLTPLDVYEYECSTGEVRMLTPLDVYEYENSTVELQDANSTMDVYITGDLG